MNVGNGESTTKVGYNNQCCSCLAFYVAGLPSCRCVVSEPKSVRRGKKYKVPKKTKRD